MGNNQFPSTIVIFLIKNFSIASDKSNINGKFLGKTRIYKA